MGQTTHINIEHIVVDSNRSYEQVKEALEARLGVAEDLDELGRQLAAANASWEQVTQAMERQLGTSGFTIFSKVEQGTLLSLAGKRGRVSQYAIGNPLLAIQMIEHAPEVALYAHCAWWCTRMGKAGPFSPMTASPRNLPSTRTRRLHL